MLNCRLESFDLNQFSSIKHLIHICSGCFECGEISELKIQCPLPHTASTLGCAATVAKAVNRTELNAIENSIAVIYHIVRLASETIFAACDAFSDITALLDFFLFNSKRSELFSI